MKGEKVDKKWLQCMVSEGQFSGEFAIQGELFDNTGFSLFVEQEDVWFKEEPVQGKSVQGLVRITALQQKDDLCLVALPQPTMENGWSVTVKRDNVKESCR